jgi:hypothetical protein
MVTEHTDTGGDTMQRHLSISSSTDEPFQVRYSERPDTPDWEVQVFLGSSFQTLYMSVEEARQFAQDILDVLPQPAPTSSGVPLESYRASYDPANQEVQA